jgi:AAA+ superfamily predicted ATPase
MNFFEDMGMLIRRGDYLDRDMVWATFSFYASNWWRACKNYIVKERERLHDNTLFTDFEYLIEEISKQNMQQKVCRGQHSNRQRPR